MGTFILRPVSVSNPNTGWEARVLSVLFPSPTDDELIDAVNSTDPNPQTGGDGLVITGIGSGSVNFSCQGLGLYLDGSLTPIDTNNLPLGFSVVSCDYKAESGLNFPPPGTEIVYSRDGFPVHTSTATESVSVALGALTNIGLISSIITVAGTTPSGSNIGCNSVRIEGIYTTALSIVPPSGDVEPGQSLAVTGNNVDIAGFVARVGDQVIPIIPKIVGPGEVILEVPTPGSDNCLDCFTACPECDDCFTACDESLESEACQDCLDACLDCLTECLDDLEAGEDCLQSVNSPPAEIPITIICQFPGPPFSGSVPLGNFTILIAEASGIYELIDGKTNDTVYQSVRDGTTYDVKIPNPNGKTGFFRS